jgi:hypothetical protein
MTRELRWGTRVATLSIAAFLAAACAPDSPTGLRSKIPPDVDRGFITGPLPFQTSFRTPEGELLEVCKDFVGEPPGGAGATQVANFTVTGNTSGAVSQSEGPFTFSLNDGECQEIFVSEIGATSDLTIAENGSSGATTTTVQVILYNGGIQPPGPTVTANSASSLTIAGEQGALVIFTNVFPEVVNGCTLTLGFWKNHTELWDNLLDANTASFITSTTFFGSGQTYLQVLNTPPLGNAYYILAHQYIAALLNAGAGANTSVVSTQLAQATQYFQGSLTLTRDQIIALAGALADFNEGITGPGHCPD